MTIILDTDIQRAKQPLRKLPNVITSFNWSGWELYGRQFIESWKKYWSPSIRLTVYYEGPEFEDFQFPEGMSWRPIEEVEFLTDFMNSLKFPLMTGLVGDHYNIQFDARMARKTFMQAYSARKFGGKIFWLDADSETVKHVPERFLDDCLPDEALCCYLGRDGWYHTESGFIGFNADHPLAKRFFKNYVHVFLVGSIFTQPGWHDCYAFDAVRQVMGNGPEFINLAKHVPHGHMHPLQVSAPGEYLYHYKGRRKETRSLKAEDLARH